MNENDVPINNVITCDPASDLIIDHKFIKLR